MFLGKGDLKICSKFTGEHPCRSATSIKLQGNFIEIALRHECSPVNFQHIFRTPFLKNTSGQLLLKYNSLYTTKLFTRNKISGPKYYISKCNFEIDVDIFLAKYIFILKNNMYLWENF